MSSGLPASTRLRLAGELHDGALQLLVGVVQKMRLAERLLGTDHPAARYVAEGEEQTLAAIEAIRRALCPFSLEPPPGRLLATRLEAVIARATTGASPAVHLDSLPDLSGFPSIEEAIAGIVGEALTNAGKHAAARNVWVNISLVEGAADICVRDDGAGFDVAMAESEAQLRRSLGLYLMRERAQAVGGILAIRSHRAAGTEVRARIPLWPDVNGQHQVTGDSPAGTNGDAALVSST